MAKLLSNDEEILLIAVLTNALSTLAPPLMDKRSFLLAAGVRQKLMNKFVVDYVGAPFDEARFHQLRRAKSYGQLDRVIQGISVAIQLLKHGETDKAILALKTLLNQEVGPLDPRETHKDASGLNRDLIS